MKSLIYVSYGDNNVILRLCYFLNKMFEINSLSNIVHLVIRFRVIIGTIIPLFCSNAS